MSDEFDGLHATERAGIGTAMHSCRALAAKIAKELRYKRPDDYVDKLSLADLCAAHEHAADVLGQKGRRPVEKPCSRSEGFAGAAPLVIIEGGPSPHGLVGVVRTC